MVAASPAKNRRASSKDQENKGNFSRVSRKPGEPKAWERSPWLPNPTQPQWHSHAHGKSPAQLQSPPWRRGLHPTCQVSHPTVARSASASQLLHVQQAWTAWEVLLLSRSNPPSGRNKPTLRWDITSMSKFSIGTNTKHKTKSSFITHDPASAGKTNIW